MPVVPPLCAEHTAFVYELGGVVLVGQIEELAVVRWNRIRDEISGAYVRVPTGNCCEFLTNVETIRHELHIYRAGEMVWCGPITRMEFEREGVDIYAEDVLWVTKRRAVSVGYNYGYPPNGPGPRLALDLADDLLRLQTYGRHGDPWNVVPGLNKITGPDDPMTQRRTNSWSKTVWEELDGLARYSGIDYTVVGRDIYYFDVHLAWSELPDLIDGHLSEYPRVVEYGNSLATRYIKTDGSGFAALTQAPLATREHYTEEIDFIETINEQSADPNRADPTDLKLAAWLDDADDSISRYFPPAVSVVIPANASLMPSSPWDVNTLIPGSWFMTLVERQCRSVSEFQRLHEVRVEEIGGTNEKVAITTSTAPASRVDPL